MSATATSKSSSSNSKIAPIPLPKTRTDYCPGNMLGIVSSIVMHQFMEQEPKQEIQISTNKSNNIIIYIPVGPKED